LADYLAANPEIDVELEERPSHDIVATVAGGLADAGIVADTVDLGGLECHPFALDRLVVIGHRDHPALAARRHLALADVAEHELVGLAAGSALQAHLARHAATAGRRLKLRVRLGSLDAVCRMAGMGVGLAIVPERSARRSQRSLGLRIVMLTDAWALRRLNLCTRRLEDLPAHARQLVERLRLHGATLAGARR
jgi:DNA-binding transcriptional LysR family regulator